MSDTNLFSTKKMSEHRTCILISGLPGLYIYERYTIVQLAPNYPITSPVSYLKNWRPVYLGTCQPAPSGFQSINQLVLYKVDQLIETGILGFIPDLYDLYNQSYIIT